MIVRNLVSRLGLDLDSAQIRVMGTSASLTDDAAGHAYLEQFFGIPADSFFVTAGQPAIIPPLSPLTRTDVLERSSKDLPVGDAATLSKVVAAACRDSDDDRIRATPMGDLAGRLFDEPDDGTATAAVLHSLASPETDSASVVPLRAHLFVRPGRGLWACTNESCSGVDEQHRRRPPDRSTPACTRLDLPRLRKPRPEAPVLLRVRRCQPGRVRPLGAGRSGCPRPDGTFHDQ